MNNSRISAKVAKNLSEKAKQEIANKNSVIKSYQKKLKKIFQKVTEVAISGEEFVEYSDEDQDFLGFCYKEFTNLNFVVEIHGSTSDKTIENSRREITELEEKIETIGRKAVSEINSLAENLYEFLIPHPEYVQVYEWLINAYDRRPLIKSDWYLWNYEKLGIVSGAEYDKLFSTHVTDFQWQGKLRKIVSDIKISHETAALKIQKLFEQIYDIEETETVVNESFRILNSDDNIDLMEIFSIKICWDEERINDCSNVNEVSFFSPQILCWVSSDSGQNFLNCVEENIKLSIEEGKDETLLRFFSNDDGTFILQFQTQEITAPSPETVIKIYLSMGFQAVTITDNNLSKKSSKKDLIDVKLSW